MPVQPKPITNPLPFAVDNTMLSTFKACPAKFLWQYVWRLEPKGRNIHLIAGGAMAAGLDAARKYQFLEANRSAPVPLDILYPIAIREFLKEWPLDLENDPENSKNIHNVLNGLEMYLTQFHPFHDTFQPLILPNGGCTSEFSIAIPLINGPKHPSGDPFVYTGRFDMLAYNTTANMLTVFDDKTTGSMGSYWAQQWDLRGQFMGYIWACQQLGYDVKSAFVRGVGFLKTDISFQTLPVEFSQHLIVAWEQELYNSLELLLHYWEKQHFPFNFADACSSYGGCPMKDLCKSEHPEEWFTSYDTNTWNPIKEEPEVK